MNDNYTAPSGGSIYAGMAAPSTLTQLEQFIAAMPANSWSQYTGTNINEMLPRDFDGTICGIFETSANLPLTNWANKFAFDPSRKIISGVGTAQGFLIPTGYNYAKQVIFDLVDNAFRVRWNPTGQTQGHVYDSNCGGFVGGKTWRKAFSNSATQLAVGEYDADTDAWSTNYTLSGLSNIATLWATECSVEHNALYLLEAITGRLVKFNLATGVRSVVGSYSGIGDYPIIVSAGEFVFFGAGATGTTIYKIDSAGAVTTVTNSIPVEYACKGFQKVVAHPDGAAKLLLMSNGDGLIRTLDSVGVWQTVGVMQPSIDGTVDTVVAASLVGMGAVACLNGKARNAGGITQSEFWIYKA